MCSLFNVADAIMYFSGELILPLPPQSCTVHCALSPVSKIIKVNAQDKVQF